jgi:hypothetical protein
MKMSDICDGQCAKRLYWLTALPHGVIIIMQHFLNSLQLLLALQ